MGKKSNISRIGAPSGIPARAPGPFSTTPALGQDQESLMVMLTHATHTVRIRGLNTVTTLLKSGNVTAITHGNMLQTIFSLMGDRMMDVGLAATALMRHVVQICDTNMLSTLLGFNLHHVCYTLLQYLSQCFQLFGQGVAIAKGHGLFWYNPSYLNMLRMVTHIVKIIASLLEVNNDLCTDFVNRVTASTTTPQTPQQTSEFQQKVLAAQESGGKIPPPPPTINYLGFFLTILSINIGTVPAILIPTLHLPFITQLQLDILHFLRVLCHENINATLLYLSTPTLVQYLLQEPALLLNQQQQTTAQTSYSPPPPQAHNLPIQPSTTINCQSDSIYTYQYCKSIALSNLYIEYQKVASNSGKTSALATSFTIHSLPHTNIELAMSIIVIIATMFEQINAQTTEFIANEQQRTTMENLYRAILTVLKYAIEQIDMNQEIAIYTQSLASMRATLVTLANGDLSLLESYNLNTAMGETATSTLDPDQFKRASRQQFKTLNINNRIDPKQQQQQLIQSLQQAATHRDGQELNANTELDQISAQGAAEADGMAVGTNTGDIADSTVANPTNDNEAFTEDEFPLHQLWNDTVSIHNTIILQYFNVKTLVTDCLSLLMAGHVEDDSEDSAEQAILKDIKQQQQQQQQAQQQQQQSQQQSPHSLSQLALLHTTLPHLFQSSITLAMLNHSYGYIHQADNLFTVPSYFPSALIFTLHDLYNSSPEDYPHYISFIAYQSTLLRVNSLGNILLMLQYNQKYKSTSTIFTENAQTIHNILLTIASSTSIARLPQQQQQPLQTLQEHYSALSSIEFSDQVSNAQPGLQRIAHVLNSTSIDEANLILQSLTTFVTDESLCELNKALWDNALLQELKDIVAPLKEKVHVTETFAQAKIDQVISQLPQETQSKHLFVSETLAGAIQNFISYFVSAQAHYQGNVNGVASKLTTIADHKKYALTSPHVEFQTVAMTYISTMAINYPLFGPLMPKIAGLFSTMLTLFTGLKMTQFNCQLLFQFINLVIDIFSEDDRLVMAYTANRLTPVLNSFAKLHSEYLTSLKQSKMALKPKLGQAKRAQAGKKAAAAAAASKPTVSLTPQKQEALIELQESLEITTEANLNLIGFVEYKRKQKL